MIGAGAVAITTSLFTNHGKDGFGGGMYGALDEQNAAGSDITITTAGTHYGWKTAEAVILNNLTADFTGEADGLVIDDGGKGDYLILGSISFSGTPNRLITGHIYISDVESHAGFRRKLGAGGDVGAAPITDVLTLDNNDKVDLRFTADVGATTVTIESCHIVLAKLSR
ncbi:MAG: hypothetical protein ACYSW8_31805 [Planctomycetota bacterium]|jgi:hypothetical protein